MIVSRIRRVLKVGKEGGNNDIFIKSETAQAPEDQAVNMKNMQPSEGDAGFLDREDLRRITSDCLS